MHDFYWWILVAFFDNFHDCSCTKIVLYGIVFDYSQKIVAFSVCRDDSDEFPSPSVPTTFLKLGPRGKNKNLRNIWQLEQSEVTFWWHCYLTIVIIHILNSQCQCLFFWSEVKRCKFIGLQQKHWLLSGEEELSWYRMAVTFFHQPDQDLLAQQLTYKRATWLLDLYPEILFVELEEWEWLPQGLLIQGYVSSHWEMIIIAILPHPVPPSSQLVQPVLCMYVT